MILFVKFIVTLLAAAAALTAYRYSNIVIVLPSDHLLEANKSAGQRSRFLEKDGSNEGHDIEPAKAVELQQPQGTDRPTDRSTYQAESNQANRQIEAKPKKAKKGKGALALASVDFTLTVDIGSSNTPTQRRAASATTTRVLASISDDTKVFCDTMSEFLKNNLIDVDVTSNVSNCAEDVNGLIVITGILTYVGNPDLDEDSEVSTVLSSALGTVLQTSIQITGIKSIQYSISSPTNEIDVGGELTPNPTPPDPEEDCQDINVYPQSSCANLWRSRSLTDLIETCRTDSTYGSRCCRTCRLAEAHADRHPEACQDKSNDCYDRVYYDDEGNPLNTNSDCENGSQLADECCQTCADLIIRSVPDPDLSVDACPPDPDYKNNFQVEVTTKEGCCCDPCDPLYLSQLSCAKCQDGNEGEEVCVCNDTTITTGLVECKIKECNEFCPNPPPPPPAPTPPPFVAEEYLRTQEFVDQWWESARESPKRYEDHGCRRFYGNKIIGGPKDQTVIGNPDSNIYYDVVSTVSTGRMIASQSDCVKACYERYGCTGVEYKFQNNNNHRCELWKTPITGRTFNSGYSCIQRLWVNFEQFTARYNHGCRSIQPSTGEFSYRGSPDDPLVKANPSSNVYFDVHSFNSMEECRTKCQDLDWCRAFEYGRNDKRCELWKTVIGNVDIWSPGYDCYEKTSVDVKWSGSTQCMNCPEAEEIIEVVPDISEEDLRRVLNWIRAEVTMVKLPFCWKHSYRRDVNRDYPWKSGDVFNDDAMFRRCGRDFNGQWNCEKKGLIVYGKCAAIDAKNFGAGYCRPDCRNGYKGVGPTCYQQCKKESCAAGCALDKGTCALTTVLQVLGPLTITANIATLGLTAPAVKVGQTAADTISIGNKVVLGSTDTGKAMVRLIKFVNSMKFDDIALGQATVVKRIVNAKTGTLVRTVKTDVKIKSKIHSLSKQYDRAYAKEFKEQTSPEINSKIDSHFSEVTANYIKEAWGRVQLEQMAEANHMVVVQSVVSAISVVDPTGIFDTIDAYLKPSCKLVDFPCIEADLTQTC